jgi:HEAT repeat protein
MDDLSQLLTQLDHPDPVRRERALADLQQRGAAALPVLRQALNVKLGPARALAAEALVGLGEPAVDYLREALQDADQEVRVWAVWALKQIDVPAATPCLLEALGDVESKIRLQSAEALAPRKGSAITEALCGGLKDQDSGVRLRVAALLGTRGDLGAASGLCEALQDPSTGVRQASCIALGVLGAELGVPGLLERLQDPLTSVRKAAAGALGELHAVCAVSALCKTLESLDLGLRDAAADALAQIGSRHTVATRHVAEVIVESDATRQALAADILVRIGDASIPELCRLLAVMRTSVRLTAARALRALATSKPSPHLRAAIPALKSELSLLSLHAEPTRDELRLTLRQIEAATKNLRHLPIPALAAASHSRELPLPAEAVVLEMDEDGLEGAQGSQEPAGKQWMRAIRRLWSRG